MASLQELMAKKKAQIAEQSGRRENPTKPPQGTTRFRILPSWRGLSDPTFYHDFAEHFVKDSKEKVIAVYICTEKTFGKPCPVCDAISEGIFNAKTDDEKNLLKKSYAGGRILVNALQIEKDANTPIVLELSPTTFDKLIDIYQQNIDSENGEFNIVTDINEGVDIMITRAGAGLKTEYSVQPALKGSKPVGKDVLKRLINLDEYVAREFEANMLKATNAVKKLMTGAKALPSSKDKEFDDSDDVPFHDSPKAGSDDVLEGDFKDVSDADVSDDELNAMLDELD
jgi:hypothetical protein